MNHEIHPLDIVRFDAWPDGVRRVVRTAMVVRVEGDFARVMHSSGVTRQVALGRLTRGTADAWPAGRYTAEEIRLAIGLGLGASVVRGELQAAARERKETPCRT